MTTTFGLLPIAVAVGVPLVFLALVRRLDLYASGRFDMVVACFLSGLAVFAVAREINNQAVAVLMVRYDLTGPEAVDWIKRAIAPLVEEVLKSVCLLYFVRRTSFTYFVDGAIYGFAAGTAFAVIENVHYCGPAGDPLGCGVNRALSVSLMHGCASALVGVSLGRFRYSRGAARVVSLLLGWSVAIALHTAFNNAFADVSADATLGMAIGTGLAGVSLVATFIYWGLRDERAWLRETLHLGAGVSGAESRIVQELADLNTLLAPVEARFGEDARDRVAEFLRLQVLLGLKLKAQALSRSDGSRSDLAAEIGPLRDRIDNLRRAIGVYCMVYVRAILPGDDEPLWGRLSQALEDAPEPTQDLWRVIGAKTGGGAQH